MKTTMSNEINMKLYVLSIVFFFVCNFTINAQVGIGTTTPKSTFEVNGSIGQKVNIVNSNITLDDTYSLVICNNGSTAITITLPSAIGITGRVYTVKRNASSTANVVIATSTEVIDGISNYTLSSANAVVTVVSDGANWQVISKF